MACYLFRLTRNSHPIHIKAKSLIQCAPPLKLFICEFFHDIYFLCYHSQTLSSESLSQDTRAILEEVTRYLNLEKLLPTYRYTVTGSCLRALRKLQEFGHIPADPTIFKAYAQYGIFIDTRLVALDLLVDFLKGKEQCWHHCLSQQGGSRDLARTRPTCLLDR